MLLQWKSDFGYTHHIKHKFVSNINHFLVSNVTVIVTHTPLPPLQPQIKPPSSFPAALMIPNDPAPSFLISVPPTHVSTIFVDQTNTIWRYVRARISIMPIFITTHIFFASSFRLSFFFIFIFFLFLYLCCYSNAISIDRWHTGMVLGLKSKNNPGSIWIGFEWHACFLRVVKSKTDLEPTEQK